MFGIVRLVLGFGGLIAGQVEFLVGDGRCFPVSPFGVAGEWSANAVTHGSGGSGGGAIVISGPWVLGEGCGFAWGVRLVECGGEAVAFERGWLRETGEFVECGKDIDEFGDGICLSAGEFETRCMNHQWNSRVIFEV